MMHRFTTCFTFTVAVWIQISLLPTHVDPSCLDQSQFQYKISEFSADLQYSFTDSTLRINNPQDEDCLRLTVGR